MESLLIIGSTVLVLSLDLYLVRINRQFFALPVQDEAGSHPNPGWTKTVNRIAWWLAVAGAVLSAPLLLLLAINPIGDRWNWSLVPGLSGMVLIVLAAGLVLAVFANQCVKHRLTLKTAAASIYRNRIKPGIQRYGVKVSLAIVAAWLLSPLIPYLLELVKVTGYIAGIWLAGRLGWLSSTKKWDDFGEQHLTKTYNYAKGKWDDGLDLGGLYHHSDEW